MTQPHGIYGYAPQLAGLLLLVALFAVIQLLVTGGHVSPFTIPAPLDILASVPRLFVRENLASLFLLTMSMTFAATFLAVAVGVPAGWLLYRYQQFGRAYEPWLGAVFSAPIILLYPLFMVVLGRNVGTIIALGFVVGVTPLVLSTYNGLRQVPRVYINVARSFNMPKRTIFTKVMVPAALPSIFTGLRLALIYAMINIVAVEFLINIGGLGYLVGDLYDRYHLPEMYAAVAFVVVASIMFFTVINRLEQWLKHR